MNSNGFRCLVATGLYAVSNVLGACGGSEASTQSHTITNTSCNPAEIVVEDNVPTEGVSTVSKLVQSSMQNSECNSQYAVVGQVSEQGVCAQNFPGYGFTNPSIMGYYEQNGHFFVRISCPNNENLDLTVDWPLN